MDAGRPEFHFFCPARYCNAMLRVSWPSPLASSAIALMLAGSLACRPDAPTEPPAEPPVEVAADPRPRVDAEQMMASIAWLASDERQGRFTLDPTIETVASWLVDHYAQLGLEPATGAEAMRVGYALRTSVEAGEHQHLAITRPGKGKPKVVDASHLVPRGQGIAGKASGELVFVGYAATWTPADQAAMAPPSSGDDDGAGEPPQLAIDHYDDLAGVDLKGKVALVLDNAPNSPDLPTLFGAIQLLAQDHEAAAKPLREAEDLDGLEKLHRESRQRLLDLVEPFIDVDAVPEAYWTIDDPKLGFDVMKLAGHLAAASAHLPQFDPRKHALTAKLERLRDAGAVGVVLVQGPRSYFDADARKRAALPDVMGALAPAPGSGGTGPRVLASAVELPVIQVDWKQADKLLRVDGDKLSAVQAAIDADLQPRSQALGIEVELETQLVERTQEVPNVVAVLPGATDEIVVVGAHFDHIGNDETGMCHAVVRRDSRDAICNGADDNGSGTALLMELARIYREAGFAPRRTIVFTHFSGEELGLLGSAALADAAPFEMDKVVAMVNLDMIGRLGPRGLAIGGINSSDQWMPLLDELGNYGMEVLYEASTTTRSDHAHWFRRQTPVLFFFTGMHGDYHRAGDELDEINVEGMAQVGQLVSDLVWELADGYAIEWSGLAPGEGIGRGLPGSNPDSVVKRVAEDGTIVEEG